MSRLPDVFPRVYVAMVEAGEAGGFLDVVLAQIAEFQAREKELRAKVIAALMYPPCCCVLRSGCWSSCSSFSFRAFRRYLKDSMQRCR